MILEPIKLDNQPSARELFDGALKDLLDWERVDGFMAGLDLADFHVKGLLKVYQGNSVAEEVLNRLSLRIAEDTK